MRHKRWAGHGEINGKFYAFHPGGKYIHPQSAGAGGSFLANEVRAVFWEGREDFARISLRAVVHPTHGDYSFMLTHGVQTTKYLQPLTCSTTSGARVCLNLQAEGWGAATYPHKTEAVFSTDTVASDVSFDESSAAHMTEATDRIGFTLMFNDYTRPGWAYADDDGSFILKHKTKRMVLIPEAGGGPIEPIQNGIRLVWVVCPTNCINDFSRDEYLNYGYVFENQAGEVCLPPGV